MSQSLPDSPPRFDDLSVEDQIDYLQSLWDRVTSTADEVPVPGWHRKIIDQRLAEIRSDPDSAQDWETVRDEIRGRLDEK